ncbi:SDR family NAD(P)-dependent oxidoreductase [Planotetraspora kaengkrachanensis]|uniref:SDR family NAD(P)-dependent oxidoreductase n=1 Tax=Planotetraspora kaengkrachanensis TaxID=575193 RepID=UPI00194178B8|nr:SDR family oxidoreductase [Planotetraspora kaengkrachanensis]
MSAQHDPPGPLRCLVTGATGIGAAVALRLADLGHRVFVVSLDPDECRPLVALLGDQAAGFSAADLRDESAAVAAFTAADEALGGVDLVVAVAGGSGRGFGDGPLHEVTLQAWEETLRLNLTTAFLTARESVRRLRRTGGSLVLVGSVLAARPSPELFGTQAYATAKAGIAGLVTTLAAMYVNDGVRVNAVAPGLVRTPMARRAASDPMIQEYARRKQPLAAGMIEPGTVAEAVCAIGLAECVTGQVLAVDGGWSVTEA